MTPDVERAVENIRHWLPAGSTGRSDLDFLERTIEAYERLVASPPPKLPDPDKNRIGKFPKEPQKSTYNAALDVYPRTGNKRRVILDLVDSHDGLCDETIEDLTGMLHQTASARRNELVEYGWLEDSGRTHRNRSGVDAIVWVLTERARLEEAS